MKEASPPAIWSGSCSAKRVSGGERIHSAFHKTNLNSAGKRADRHLCSRLKSEAKSRAILKQSEAASKVMLTFCWYYRSPKRDFGCLILGNDSTGGSQEALPDGCLCSVAARWSVITMTTYRYRMRTVAGARADPDCVCMAQSGASLPRRGAKNMWIHR